MEVTAEEWICFFQEARIPRTAAAQYAMTFIKNRISMDSLLDLNKASNSKYMFLKLVKLLKFYFSTNILRSDIHFIQEYLKDMGIIVLSDINAILKHAKQVQRRLTTDNALTLSQNQDQHKGGSLTIAPSSSKEPSSFSDLKKYNQRESRAVMIKKVEISKEKDGYGI